MSQSQAMSFVHCYFRERNLGTYCKDMIVNYYNMNDKIVIIVNLFLVDGCGVVADQTLEMKSNESS